MDKHQVAEFYSKARRFFRQPQGSSHRIVNRSEPPPKVENVLASLDGATSLSVNPNTNAKVRNLEYRRNRLAACQRELESLKAANGVLKRQLKQQELEERIRTENLRIWQVLAIKELESRFEERAPPQRQQIMEIETCQNIQYTAGATKIMGASDGDMQCFALFLTESLVNSMCQVIEETRELELAQEPYAAAKNEAEIGRGNVEYAKSMLEQAETKEQFEYFQETLEKNESQMLRDIKRKDLLRDDFQLKKLKLEHSQAGLLTVLEQVLTEAQLMPGKHEESLNRAQTFPDRETLSERTQSEVAADVGPFPACVSRYSMTNSKFHSRMKRISWILNRKSAVLPSWTWMQLTKDCITSESISTPSQADSDKKSKTTETREEMPTFISLRVSLTSNTSCRNSSLLGF